jgi:hypothetical protein
MMHCVQCTDGNSDFGFCLGRHVHSVRRLSTYFLAHSCLVTESASAKHCDFVIENTNSKNGRLYQVDRSAATPKLLEFGANQQMCRAVYEFVQTTYDCSSVCWFNSCLG